MVDEFSELLSAQPEFIDLFVAIGRLGRSLGLHLLLASQRLEEGRLRGLESHLSYRIGLRTFSAQESRAVLGVPDAYELPAVPGLGYLRTDPTTLVRFTAAYVSGRRVRDAGRAEPRASSRSRIADVPLLDAGPEAPRERDSVLELAVRRMAAGDRPRTRCGCRRSTSRRRCERGDPALAWRARRAAVGTVDRPREQRRDTLSVDLSGSAGHVAVVGGPRSGKSTLLRTVVACLALASTPLGDAALRARPRWGTSPRWPLCPTWRGSRRRTETDVVRRIVAEVQGIVERREARGRADDRYGEVFLVMDGWGTLRSDFDDLEAVVQQVATRGLAFGVHVVASATRWADFRPAMRDLFGTRLELRLGDPVDSEIDRRAAAPVPVGRPGRGLVADGLHFLGGPATVRGPRGPARTVPGCGCSGARPDRRVDARRGLGCVWASREDLRPVALDPSRAAPARPRGQRLGQDLGAAAAGPGDRPHPDARRGADPARRPPPDVPGEVPDDYLLDDLEGVVAAPAGAGRPGWAGPGRLRARRRLRPGRRRRSRPLVPLLPRARDVGLHLVVARRSGGASRALFEPVIQSLRDLPRPGCCSPATLTRGRCWAACDRRPRRPGAAGWSPVTAGSRWCRWPGRRARGK